MSDHSDRFMKPGFQLPPEIKKALDTFGHMPGLRAGIVDMKKSGHRKESYLYSLSLQPDCVFDDAASANAFGIALNNCCFPWQRKHGNENPDVTVQPDAQDPTKFEVSVNIASTFQLKSFPYFAKIRASDAEKYIKRSGPELAALLATKGLDTSGFKGFSKQLGD